MLLVSSVPPPADTAYELLPGPLPAMVQFTILAVALSTRSAWAPKMPDLFPVNRQLVTVAKPPFRIHNPPLPFAVLPRIAQRSNSGLPPLATTPPPSSA